MSISKPGQSRVDSISSIYNFHTKVDVLRLDVIHPIISGNKWFKLKEYLKDAESLHKKTIVTFGGAFSNHILATAAAAELFGFKSIGIIRGEEPINLSFTLQEAKKYRMQLYFLSRETYKQKKLPQAILDDYDQNDIYLISEGGYGIKGMEGAASILHETDFSSYTHIIAAVGTGTMLAGLTYRSYPNQKVIGISVLKNNYSLSTEIEQLLPENKHHQYTLLHDYHFGGYAKYKPELIHFMNEWYSKTRIPSDFVYTAKMFFAVNDLIKQSYFLSDSRILLIHSGGLQGNNSLTKGTLIF
jgi:1-aminocyclopropane-1-carboxylate deaminase